MSIIVFGIVFGLLFLGELGDKTQLIVFNITLEYKKPVKIALGATLGFAVIVSLGVFFGTIITQFIPVFYITLLSGIVFIIIGLLEARELKKLYKQKQKNINIDEEKNGKINGIGTEESLKSGRFSKLKENPYLAGFLSIFIMELGDKTQLLTISLASIYQDLLAVWLGSFLALSSLAWIGAFFGGFIAEKVPKFYLKLLAVSIFITVGIIVMLTSLL